MLNRRRTHFHLWACLFAFSGLLLVTPHLWSDDESPAENRTTVPAYSESNGHGDPIAPVLLGIVVVMIAARIGGHCMEIVDQPAVLGELLVGVVLGNMTLVGIDAFEFLKVDYTQQHLYELQDFKSFAGVTIDHFARIGVILLLFQVGLESSVTEMRKVGSSAVLVALIGVIGPALLGWACGRYLLPQHHWAVHMFIGATLCATSVGITARVLHDLDFAKSAESQIILGAAVIDDVLGLVVLALAQGMIASLDIAAAGGHADFGIEELAIIFVKAFGFLAGAILLGQYISRPLFHLASYLRGRGLLIISSLALCFAFSWAANAAGLATIVGAFAAGLILEEVHYRELLAKNQEQELESLMRPLISLFVPIFFVEMGVHVDLRSFADQSVLGLAVILTLAAILGKQLCGLGVVQKGIDRVTIGIGMVPRGEVGLIFAAIGLQLKIGDIRIIELSTYSALVIMVIVTTLVTPPALRWSIRRRNRRQSTSVT